MVGGSMSKIETCPWNHKNSEVLVRGDENTGNLTTLVA